MMDQTSDWIFPKEFIDNPRGENYDESRIQKEHSHRSRTIWFMEDLSKTLRMDRRVVSTSCVYFHRFYLFHSFDQQNRFHTAVACLFLAGKVEERAYKLKDLVLMFLALKSPADKPDEMKLREEMKAVILAERLLLQTLNFDLNVIQPYTYFTQRMKDLKPYYQYISESSRNNFIQTAVNFLNDSFRCTFCLQYSAVHIAIACIYLATVSLSIEPQHPNSNTASSSRHHHHHQHHLYQQQQQQQQPPLTWIELFEKDIDEYTLRCISLELISMYEKLAEVIPMKETHGRNSSSSSSSAASRGEHHRKKVASLLVEELDGRIPEHLQAVADDLAAYNNALRTSSSSAATATAASIPMMMIDTKSRSSSSASTTMIGLQHIGPSSSGNGGHNDGHNRRMIANNSDEMDAATERLYDNDEDNNTTMDDGGEYSLNNSNHGSGGGKRSRSHQQEQDDDEEQEEQTEEQEVVGHHHQLMIQQKWEKQHQALGSSSVVSSYGGGNNNNNNPETPYLALETPATAYGGSVGGEEAETPVFFPPPQTDEDDTPSNTPRFSDLATAAKYSNRKERSNSLTDNIDTKRARTE